jgi:oligopeptide transport system substrate-binding protein
MPGHSAGIGPTYAPEQARRLLADAGYPEGRGFPIVEALAFDAAEDRVTYLRAQWQETLGVDVRWQTPRWATFIERLKNKDHHLLYAMWVADYPDPDNFLRVSRAETWSSWTDASYERLVAKAKRAMNQSERMALYRQADEILMTHVPILPLSYEREHLLIKPWVRRYPMAANQVIFWKDVILESHD